MQWITAWAAKNSSIKKKKHFSYLLNHSLLKPLGFLWSSPRCCFQRTLWLVWSASTFQSLLNFSVTQINSRFLQVFVLGMFSICLGSCQLREKYNWRFVCCTDVCPVLFGFKYIFSYHHSVKLYTQEKEKSSRPSGLIKGSPFPLGCPAGRTHIPPAQAMEKQQCALEAWARSWEGGREGWNAGWAQWGGNEGGEESGLDQEGCAFRGNSGHQILTLFLALIFLHSSVWTFPRETGLNWNLAAAGACLRPRRQMIPYPKEVFGCVAPWRLRVQS